MLLLTTFHGMEYNVKTINGSRRINAPAYLKGEIADIHPIV
jgi:hypothetical protein